MNSVLFLCLRISPQMPCMFLIKFELPPPVQKRVLFSTDGARFHKLSFLLKMRTI